MPQPAAYLGFKLDWQTGATATGIGMTNSLGGWGSMTMGLLTPTGSVSHSYGLFGQAVSTTSPAYDAGAQGFVATQADMVTLSATAKYMIVSIWANNWTQTASSNNYLVFEFSAKAWGP